jgi:hypothetical protein
VRSTFQAGHAGSIPVARSIVIFHDTGMATTLIGSRALPGGRRTDGTVQSEERQAPVIKRPRQRAWAAWRRHSWDLPARRPVIQTDRLGAAGTGQQDNDRGQAPREPTGTVQRGKQNVPRERFRLARL